RFGSGAWHGIDATRLLEAPLSPLCIPELARELRTPADLARQTLLRSYRADEWAQWFLAAGVTGDMPLPRSIMFDSSLAMMEAAMQGAGIALAPPLMFSRQLLSETIVQPFETTVTMGSYWLTRLQSRAGTEAMSAFRGWLTDAATNLAQTRTNKKPGSSILGYPSYMNKILEILDNDDADVIGDE